MILSQIFHNGAAKTALTAPAIVVTTNSSVGPSFRPLAAVKAAAVMFFM